MELEDTDEEGDLLCLHGYSWHWFQHWSFEMSLIKVGHKVTFEYSPTLSVSISGVEILLYTLCMVIELWWSGTRDKEWMQSDWEIFNRHQFSSHWRFITVFKWCLTHIQIYLMNPGWRNNQLITQFHMIWVTCVIFTMQIISFPFLIRFLIEYAPGINSRRHCLKSQNTTPSVPPRKLFS